MHGKLLSPGKVTLRALLPRPSRESQGEGRAPPRGILPLGIRSLCSEEGRESTEVNMEKEFRVGRGR